MKNYNLIIDFDSTFIKTESLEDLASIALEENLEKDKILKKIQEITDKGMGGSISFSNSCVRRFKLLEANKIHFPRLISKLKNNVSNSIKDYRDFFLKNSENIYILSSGARCCIVPVVRDFGIRASHIFTNEFQFDSHDDIVGFDKKNILTKNQGKVKKIQELNLASNDPNKKIVMIGDGWTDYETRREGVVDIFIAYTENISRKKVVEQADFVAGNWGEVLDCLEK